MTEKEVLKRVTSGDFNNGHGFDMQLLVNAVGALGEMFRDGRIQMIDEQPTVNGWISVEDRLPEVGKVVLAFGTRSATTGMFQGVSVRNDCWWWKGHTIKHVSYWMPLPEPPKEVCNNEV